MHITLRLLPKRARFRSANADPRLVKSKIASVDPNLPIPVTAKALFTREKERSDNELPRCKKSNTATELPSRAKLRKLSADPRCRKSRVLTDDPSRAKLRRESELPT
jgi:hypothetical protein